MARLSGINLAILFTLALLPVRAIQAAGLPLATMATVSGTIDGTTITLNGDSAANLISVQFLSPPGPPGPGYRFGTGVGDTISITDNAGNATIINNSPNLVTVTIADPNVTAVVINGGDGDDNLQVMSANDPITLSGDGNNDTLTIGANVTGTLNGGTGDDLFTIPIPNLLNGTVNGQTGTDTLQRAGDNLIIGLTGSTADGFSGTATGISGGFTDINTVQATGTNTKLVAQSSATTNTWDLDGTPTHNNGSHTLSFSGFTLLQGSSLSNDNFLVSVTTAVTMQGIGGDNSLTLSNDAQVNSTFAGATGTDTLNLVRDSMTVSLTDETTSGWNGTADSPTGFTGIDVINTTGTANTLSMDFQTLAVPALWSFDGTPTLTYEGEATLSHSGFASVTGNTQENEFTVSANTTVNIDGREGIDSLAVTNDATVTGYFHAGSGTSDVLSSTQNDFNVAITTNFPAGVSGTANNISQGFSGVNEFQATGTSAVFSGNDMGSTWTLGSVQVMYKPGAGAAVDLSGFSLLTGGTGNDSFAVTSTHTTDIAASNGNDSLTIAVGASLDGSFTGGPDADTIESLNDSTVVTLTSSSIVGFNGTHSDITGGFLAVDEVIGTGNGTVLEGSASVTSDPAVWTLDGTPTFSNNSQTLEFSGFATLDGAAGGNVFNVTSDTSVGIIGDVDDDQLNLDGSSGITGSFAAGASSGEGDSLNSTFSPFDVVLTASDSEGFDGTAVGVDGGFTGVDIIDADGGMSTLTGLDVASTWTIDTPSTYSDGTYMLTFSDLGTAIGGSSTDEFFVNGTLTIKLDGGTGNDTFTLGTSANITGSIAGIGGMSDILNVTADNAEADLTGDDTGGFDGTITGVSMGFTDIDEIHASGDMSTLGGTAGGSDCTWSIDSTPTLSTSHTLDFSGFEIIDGCTGVLNSVDFSASIDSSIQSLEFNGQGRDDEFTITLNGGTLDIPLTLHGNGQMGPGDSLALTNIGTVDIEYLFGAPGGEEKNAELTLEGSSTITFTGLENLPLVASGSGTVTADFQPFLDTLELQEKTASTWHLLLGGVEYLSGNNFIGGLIIRPPESDETHDFLINEFENLSAPLDVEDTADSTTVRIIGPVAPANSQNIAIAADRIEVAGAVTLSGAGTLSFSSNGDIDLESGSASLTTADSAINLIADFDSDNVGEFSSVNGSSIDSGTGDILIQGTSMDLQGTVSGGSISLLASVTEFGSFLIGASPPSELDYPAGTGSTVSLTTEELSHLTASTLLTIGDDQHDDILIVDSLDFTGLTPALHLVTKPVGRIQDQTSTGTDIIVGQFTPDSILQPGGSNASGIFDLQGDLITASTTTFDVELGGASPGNNVGDHDQVNVAGAIDLSASPTLQLSLINSLTPSANQQFVIVNNDGSDAITGTFNGLAEGATVSAGGHNFTISYLGTDGSTGNDVVLTSDDTVMEEIFIDGFEDLEL